VGNTVQIEKCHVYPEFLHPETYFDIKTTEKRYVLYAGTSIGFWFLVCWIPTWDAGEPVNIVFCVLAVFVVK